VVTLDYDPTGSFYASGSSDSTVRVWDVEKGFCTHNFKGHQGVVSCVKFHSKPNEWTLISAGEDSQIRVWDMITKRFPASFLFFLSYGSVESHHFPLFDLLCT